MPSRFSSQKQSGHSKYKFKELGDSWMGFWLFIDCYFQIKMILKKIQAKKKRQPLLPLVIYFTMIQAPYALLNIRTMSCNPSALFSYPTLIGYRNKQNFLTDYFTKHSGIVNLELSYFHLKASFLFLNVQLAAGFFGNFAANCTFSYLPNLLFLILKSFNARSKSFLLKSGHNLFEKYNSE